jgi:hypothetical protein
MQLKPQMIEALSQLTALRELTTAGDSSYDLTPLASLKHLEALHLSAIASEKLAVD